MKTRIGRVSAAFLAVALMAGGSAAASGDEPDWQAAYLKLSQTKQKKGQNPGAYVQAILQFGEATYEKRDEKTAGILLNILLEELKDDAPDGKKEEKIDGRILEACETALQKVKSKAAVDILVAQVRGAKSNVRYRVILCRTLGVQKGEAIKALTELVDDKETRLQIGAIDGLIEHHRLEVGTRVEALTAQINDLKAQADQVLAASARALEEKPAAFFKTQCEDLPNLLDGLVTGFAKKDAVAKVMELIRGTAAGITVEAARKKLEPLVMTLDESVTKYSKAAEELGAAREGVAPVVAQLLKAAADPKRSWEVRVGAVAALRVDRCAGHADGLLEALTKCGPEDGRLKVDLMQALGAILGLKEPKTDDPNWWKGALTERRAGKRPGEGGGTTATPTEFFGLKTKSTRIVFILDRTGSMDFPCSDNALPKKKGDPPKKGPDTATGEEEKLPPAEEIAKKKSADIKKKWDDRKVEKRMDALKKEFINTIYNLDPRVQFTVIFYEANPAPWRNALVQANWLNKFECIHDVDRISPSGGTNIWDALEGAFRYVSEPTKPEVIIFDKKGNYIAQTNGPDTFFLMTDGNHNNGRFSIPTPPYGDFDENAFFSEFKKINTVRKVVVNTIILGDTDAGAKNEDPIKQKSLSLFRRIAESSGGVFVHLGK
ncbi:MAG TPA: hypothetical protein VGK61_06310 [Planctomycetota bacterium]